MVGKKLKKGAQPVGEMVASLLDPMMRKKVGLNVELFDNWQQIVGDDIGEMSEPCRLIWPRQARDSDEFEPACLLVACEGMAAMKLTHQTTEVIARINCFFGYGAIGRIRIEQRPVHKMRQQSRAVQPIVTEQDEQRLNALTADIDDAALRQSLIELGKGVYAQYYQRANKKLHK